MMPKGGTLMIIRIIKMASLRIQTVTQAMKMKSKPR